MRKTARFQNNDSASVKWESNACMYITLWRKIEFKILDPRKTVSEKQKKMHEPWHLFPFRDHHCNCSTLHITYLDIWHSIPLWRITNNLYWKVERSFCWWEHLISAWVLQLFEISFLAQTQLVACMLLHSLPPSTSLCITTSSVYCLYWHITASAQYAFY